MKARCCICDEMIELPVSEFYVIEQIVEDYVCTQCSKIERKLIEEIYKNLN